MLNIVYIIGTIFRGERCNDVSMTKTVHIPVNIKHLYSICATLGERLRR